MSRFNKYALIFKYILTLICWFFFNQVQAQEEQLLENLIADRPDATESPNAVSPGTLQIETGSFYTSFEKEKIKNEILGLNTTLLRYGLLDRLELRVGWNFEEVRTSLDGNKLNHVQSGFSPMLVGMKVEVTEEKGLLPEIGLLVHTYLPLLASSDYRPETTGVDFRFSFAHTIDEKSGIAYNLGSQWGNDSSEAAFVYTIVYGYAINDKLSVYAEFYGDMPEDNKANHYFDTGLTYLINNNVQLDAYLGRGVNDVQDILLGAGISIRIPK